MRGRVTMQELSSCIVVEQSVPQKLQNLPDVERRRGAPRSPTHDAITPVSQSSAD